MRGRSLVVGIAGFASFLAFGQTEDALRDVQAVVVGEVLTGTSSESGTTVNVTAQLRVRRVVVGALAPGAQIPLAWNYQIRGMWPREDTATIGQVSGLWLLKQAAGGVWQPQPVAMNVPGAKGGVYLPATDGMSFAEYYYPPDADPQAKMAMELGGAIAAVALKVGDRLNPEPVEEGPGRTGYRVTQEQVQFGEWVHWLGRLKPAATLPVYQRFVASPSANLRAVGYSGLLKQGNAAALAALERDLPAIAGTLMARQVGDEAYYPPLAASVASLQTLGRIMIAEQVLPSIEIQAPSVLGHSHKREALPYLAVMLDHPDRDRRTSVVMSICELIHARRDAEMVRHCPDRSPLRDKSQEPTLVQYWKAWWVEQPDSRGAVRSPDRYRTAAAPPPERVIGMEERFGMMALMYGASEKKRKLDPSQPEWPVVPEAKLSPEDTERARRICLEVGRAQDELQAATAELKQNLRMQNRPWDGAAYAKLAAVAEAAVRQGLDQLRRELSREGWAAAEKSMKEMDIR